MSPLCTVFFRYFTYSCYKNIPTNDKEFENRSVCRVGWACNKLGHREQGSSESSTSSSWVSTGPCNFVSPTQSGIFHFPFSYLTLSKTICEHHQLAPELCLTPKSSLTVSVMIFSRVTTDGNTNTQTSVTREHNRPVLDLPTPPIPSGPVICDCLVWKNLCSVN